MLGASAPPAASGAASRAWDGIEPECREKLLKNRTAAGMQCLQGHFWEESGLPFTCIDII